MNENIRNYWDERAVENFDSQSATTNDIHLRNLEIKTIIRTLQELPMSDDLSILDVGCGDGFSTIEIAKAFPNWSFIGMDFSSQMIENATRNLATHPELKDQVNFCVGDVTDLQAIFSNKSFNIILSDRCLINLDSFENQCNAIKQIAEKIEPGGYYIAIENFIEGQNNLNNARKNLDLPAIPVRWHNLFFNEDKFKDAAGKYFQEIVFKDFSSAYYFATRLVYSKMCQIMGEKPDYDHVIHRLSIDLPDYGLFSPIRMVVLRK